MKSTRPNSWLKTLLIFNVCFLCSAADNFLLEASFDGHLENSFATASALSPVDKENILTTTTPLIISRESDPSLYTTELAYGTPDVYNGNRFAQASFRDNLDLINFRSNPIPVLSVVPFLCSKGSTLVNIVRPICSAISPHQPSGSTPPPPESREATRTDVIPNRDSYFTENPALSGAFSIEHRSLILPSQVSSSIIKATIF